MQKAPRIDPAEHEVTQDLLRDFGVDGSVTVEKVYKISWERFSTIESSEELIQKLGRSISILESDISPQIAKIVHQFMYTGLYPFAGEFRSNDDPGDGLIYFGKQSVNESSFVLPLQYY